jgi:hypothetical protein
MHTRARALLGGPRRLPLIRVRIFIRIFYKSFCINAFDQKIERNSIKHQTGAASISMAKIFINFD